MKQFALSFPERPAPLPDELLMFLKKEEWKIKKYKTRVKKICLRCGARIEVLESIVFCLICPHGDKGRMVLVNGSVPPFSCKKGVAIRAARQLEFFQNGENLGRTKRRPAQ